MSAYVLGERGPELLRSPIEYDRVPTLRARVHTYRRWARIPLRGLLPRDVSQLVEHETQRLSAELRSYCQAQHLRIVRGPTTITRTSDGDEHFVRYGRCIVIVAEVRACGTDPETRMPHGAWGWIKAAFRRD